MSEAPPDVKQELRRSVAFTAVFDLWTGLDNFSDEAALEFLAPHQQTIAQLVDEYPSLEPVVDENPAELIEDDLEQAGLLEDEITAQHFELVRDFYNENDVLPVELDDVR